MDCGITQATFAEIRSEPSSMNVRSLQFCSRKTPFTENDVPSQNGNELPPPNL